MVMHEEFLEGNFSSFEDLRKANLEQATLPHVTQVNYIHYMLRMELYCFLLSD